MQHVVKASDAYVRFNKEHFMMINRARAAAEEQCWEMFSLLHSLLGRYAELQCNKPATTSEDAPTREQRMAAHAWRSDQQQLNGDIHKTMRQLRETVDAVYGQHGCAQFTKAALTDKARELMQHNIKVLEMLMRDPAFDLY